MPSEDPIPVDLVQYLANRTPIERELARLFYRQERLVIFDIGACEGEESIRYARCFPKARIFSFEPLPAMMQRLNRHFGGWKRYFSLGHTRREYRQLNCQMLQRVAHHLRRRSQRPYRVPKGTSVYRHVQNLGLQFL